MKLRLVTLLGLLFLIKNTFAQQEFKKINLDSLVLVTPIVDAAKMGDGNANTFDAALSSKISQELFESLKHQLPGVRYKSIPDLETLSQRQYIDITHNYLTWSKSKKLKAFVVLSLRCILQFRDIMDHLSTKVSMPIFSL
ncbi:hypothetical protein EA772_09155 [Pedobacter sp. G11]|uniref:hypothetical protein n=1 Tax=Pedobacter sp. G11 TaxID=2482728 RepID=UPI000F5F22F4|nr:hypothetical protein [Pedobacter sp. G11]AZI25505.1 hypothetical protein EA772_09155 [Pedobacter sp. G11]